MFTECEPRYSYYIWWYSKNMPLLFHHYKDAFNDIVESSIAEVKELMTILRPRKQQDYNVAIRETKTYLKLNNYHSFK